MRKLSPERIDDMRRLGEVERSLEVPAILEAMFLIAAADGDVSTEELGRFADSVVWLLSDVAEADLDGMLAEMGSALAEEGWERRARAVGRALTEKRMPRRHFGWRRRSP
jgi:hypothetical protein